MSRRTRGTSSGTPSAVQQTLIGSSALVAVGVVRLLKVKRVYEPLSSDDGERILVDRLWPRGLTKASVHAEWRRDLAPSDALRKWYGHDPEKWDEFRRRYREELEQAGKWKDVEEIAKRARSADETLVFGSRELVRNQAVAHREMALGR